MRFRQSGYGFRHYQPSRQRWSWLRSIFKKKSTHPKIVRSAEIGINSRTNPYTKTKAGYRPMVIVLTLVMLIVAWIALMLYLPYFNITQVMYSGLHIIKKAELESVVNPVLYKKSFLQSNNFFTVNIDSIKNEINKTFALESVMISKKFPNQLLVDIKEKISTLIYDNGHSYYLLDQNGKVLKELGVVGISEITPISPSGTTTSAGATTMDATTSLFATFKHIPDYKSLRREYGPYPILVDERGVDAAISSTIRLPANYISGLIGLSNALNNDPVLHINYFTTNDPLAGANAYINKPWIVMYLPAGDIAEQLSNLRVIIRDNKPTEYIDVRFKQRVYWK